MDKRISLPEGYQLFHGGKSYTIKSISVPGETPWSIRHGMKIL